MKFSQTTLVAILASMAVANSMPQGQVAGDLVVARSDVLEVLQALSEFKELFQQKRDLDESHPDFQMIAARSDSALADFISALSSSGLFSDIWNILTTDDTLKTEFLNLAKSAISGLISQGPALISAIWNSGLLQDIFNKFVNDSQLRDSLFALVSSIFETVIGFFTGDSSSSTPTASAAAAAPSASAAAKREFDIDVEKIKREFSLNFSDSEDLSKRDVLDTFISIAEAIYDSGFVQSLIAKATADPQATMNFLSSAFQTGLTVGEDVYGWAKSSGILDDVTNDLQANGATYLQDFLNIVSSLFGAAAGASSGSTAPVASAAAGTSTPSSAADAPAADASAAPVAAPVAASSAAPIAAPVAASTAAPIVSAVAVGGSDNDILASLDAVYGGAVPTTLVKRMLY
jgi:hypothetical protein